MPIHGTSPQAKAATASAPATVTVGVEHDATTDGIQLLPGQVWSDEDWRGRVSGIASGAGTTVAVVEFGG